MGHCPSQDWDRHCREQEQAELDSFVKELEDAIRERNEGRNLKRYGIEYRGYTHCDKCKQTFQHVPMADAATQETQWTCQCGEICTINWFRESVSYGGCFDLFSFGWKDADLEPWGCNGIDEIVGADEDNVKVLVSGHKTFTDPTYECSWDLSEEDKSSYSEMAHSIVCDAAGSGNWTGDDWSFSFSEEITVPWAMSDESGSPVVATAEAVIEAAREAIKPYEDSWVATSEALDGLYRELWWKYEPETAPPNKSGEEDYDEEIDH